MLTNIRILQVLREVEREDMYLSTHAIDLDFITTEVLGAAYCAYFRSCTQCTFSPPPVSPFQEEANNQRTVYARKKVNYHIAIVLILYALRNYHC